MQYFSIFFKTFNKPLLIFCAFGQKRKLFGNFETILKIFDENSMEKLNFYFIFIFILETLLQKIEPSEITPFFYNNFFGFGGGFPPSPWLRHWYDGHGTTVEVSKIIEINSHFKEENGLSLMKINFHRSS